MKDLCFTRAVTEQIQPQLIGKTSAQGLILYQKILVLLLSLSTSSYRQKAGTQLVSLLQGANTPPDDLLLALGSIACAQVTAMLQPSDLQKVQTLTANAKEGRLSITLQLVAGQTYTGALT